MTFLILEIIYAFFCIAFAKWNAVRFSKGKTVYHGVNGAIHIIKACICGWFFGICAGLAILCLARVVFDGALNWFRFKTFDYTPENPKSILDIIEKWFFKKKKILAMKVETALWVLLNILIFLL